VNGLYRTEHLVYIFIRGIHRYVLVSAHFGWRYNTSIQAAILRYRRTQHQ